MRRFLHVFTLTAGSLAFAAVFVRPVFAQAAVPITLVKTFGGHKGEVKGLAFSPDGRYFVSSGDEINFWDITTGRATKTIPGSNFAFFPDGKRFAYSRFREVFVCEIDTFACQKYAGNNDLSSSAVLLIRLLPEREKLLVLHEKSLRVWDLKSKTSEETPVAAEQFNLPALTNVSSDGERRVYSDYKTIKLEDVDTGSRSVVGVGDGWPVRTFFSPDGKYLAVPSFFYDNFSLWQASSAVKAGVLGSPDMPPTNRRPRRNRIVYSMAFSADSMRILEGGSDGNVYFWSVPDGRLLRAFRAHDPAVWALAFSPDERMFVSGGEAGEIKLWALSPGAELKPEVSRSSSVLPGEIITTYGGYGNTVSALSVSPTGLIAAGSWDSRILTWDQVSVNDLAGHKGWVRAIGYDPDGKLLASGGDDKIVRLWDVDKRTCIKEISGFHGLVSGVAFSLSGRYIAAADWEGTFSLINRNDWEVGKVKLSSSPLQCVAVSPENVFAVADNVGTITLLDTKLRVVKKLRVPGGMVHSLLFSPDGKSLLSGGRDGMIRAWDVSSGNCLKEWPAHDSVVRALSASPDKTSFASAGWDGKVKVWGFNGDPLSDTFTITPGYVWGVGYLPDGRNLAVAHDPHSVSVVRLK